MKKLLSKLLPKKNTDLTLSYEERKYPAGIIILVIMMTLLLLYFGERALSDVNDGIPRIPYPNYSQVEEQIALRNFQDSTLYPLQNRKRTLESDIRSLERQYDTSLLENIAGGQDRLYDSDAGIRETYQQKQSELAQVQQDLTQAQATYKTLEKAAIEARKPIMEEYKQAQRFRQLRVLFWEMLFWLPFFIISTLWYTRTKRNDSRWEIVSIAALTASSILALQSICFFLWSWIPFEFLEKLWIWLSATVLTRLIGYYLFVGLTIAVFGLAILWLHARMTDPLRGGRKKIRQGHCPKCNYPLNLSSNYCGGCKTQLRDKCKKCGALNYTWHSCCTDCGKADFESK